MTIGIVSPFSAKDLVPWLDDESKIIAQNLSSGVAPAVTTLTIEFLRQGYKLVVFSLDPLAERNYRLCGRNITIYIGVGRFKNKIKRVWSTLGGNIRLLKKLFALNHEKIDVISAHWTREYAIASLYYVSKCPIFVTIRDIMPYIIKQVPMTLHSYIWIVAAIMNEYVIRNKSFKFISNSDYTAKSVERIWGVSTPIIYNPLNEEYFNYEVKAKKDTGNFSIVSISVSGIDDQRKNISSLVDAIQIVRTKYPTVTLNLIGPYFTDDNIDVRKYKDSGKLEGVNLIGHKSHSAVIEYLRTADLMVHPSLEETFGNTLVEAMASNCATLGGSNSGAVPFVLEHGKAGFLCDVSNHKDIAEKILYIIEHPEEKRKVEQYAMQFCLNNFSSSIIANKYLELFKKGLQ